MKVREARSDDRAAWLRQRNALWPRDPDANRAAVGDCFGKGSHLIDQAYVAEEDGNVVGFFELRLRSYAEGSDQPRVPYLEGDEPYGMREFTVEGPEGLRLTFGSRLG